jgi:hypothetical protein
MLIKRVLPLPILPKIPISIYFFNFLDIFSLKSEKSSISPIPISLLNLFKIIQGQANPKRIPKLKASSAPKRKLAAWNPSGKITLQIIVE